MVFRFPSHQLDSFVPTPRQQQEGQLQTQQPPGQNEFWRGSLVVIGSRDSNLGGTDTISVVAVETDGEKMPQWPQELHVHVMRDPPVLPQFRAWMAAQPQPVPTCAFMADRCQGSTVDPTVNLGHFRSLSRLLFERNMIAIARWPDGSFPGGGIVFHPINNGTTMLVGSVFHYAPLPDFRSFPAISPTSSPRQYDYAQHAQRQLLTIQHTHYGSSPQHRHDPSLSPHGSNPNSPIEQPISAQGRVSYHRFMGRPGPSTVYNPHMNAPDPNTWVKAEDENGYAVLPTHDPTHPYP